MSGLEWNKIAAAVLVAGVVAMVAGVGAEHLHHSEFPEKRGFSVEVVEDAAPGAAAPVALDVPALMAAANAEAGAEVHKKCLSCHTFGKGEPNRVGPNLWGIIGNKKAHADGFAYSSAMQAAGGGWDYEDLFHFLNSPSKFVPGTKMSFAGLKKPEDIANLLAYLRTQADSPYPLPAAK